MFIKMKRTQSCASGVYRFGVIYEIDEKKMVQVNDAERMLKRGFAENISKKELAEINAKGQEVVPSSATIAADKAAADKVAADEATADKAAAEKVEPKDSAAKGDK